MSIPTTKEEHREAFLRRLRIYWDLKCPHRFLTRIGEIYEVDFGENVGDEFSGRHLGVCLEDTSASQSKTLVIPLTTKYKEYNIHKEDIVETHAIYNGRPIVAGAVLGEARWISKLRIFPRSVILEEPAGVQLSYVKATVKLDIKTQRRWRKI